MSDKPSKLSEAIFCVATSIITTSIGIYAGELGKTGSVLKSKITEHKHEAQTDTIDGKPVVYCTKCLDIIGEIQYNTPAVSEE